jgi:hypothetical protein
MRRTLTAITAAIFATAMTLPAFAQVGAGVSGNANVGSHSMHAGASGDVGNSDAERTEPNAPAGSTSTTRRAESSKTTESTRDHGVGANAGVGANVGGLGAHVGAGANAGSDNNSATGGY